MIDPTPTMQTLSPTKADPAQAARLKQLRTTVDQAVGTVFFGTLLRGARESSLKSDFGHGGRGEEIFQAQLDQVFAENAGRAGGTDIGDAIFDRFAHAALRTASKERF